MDLIGIRNSFRLDSSRISYFSDGRPNFSYAQLIAYALLDSEELKLSLNNIYEWICEKFPYYRSKDKKVILVHVVEEFY